MADLPPKKRQSFENIVLGCLFVGSGYPDFDAVLSHIKQELSVSESIVFNGKQIKVVFKPMLCIADLIGKSKILKTKQCNGFTVALYAHKEEYITLELTVTRTENLSL